MFLFVFLSLAFYIYTSKKILRGICLELPGNFVRRSVTYALMAGAGILALWERVPLPAFYLFVYLTACMALVSSGKSRQKAFFIVNTRFLLFAAVHLTVLGFISLFTGMGIDMVLRNTDLRGACVVITLAADALTDIVVARAIKGNNESVLNNSGDESRLLAGAAWFWVIFVMIDSIPSMFDLPDVLVSLFLIGSSLIILLMIVFYYIHVYVIIKNTYLEEENIRLRREQELQLSRIARMERRAYTDMLTGVYSRSYVMESLYTMAEAGEPFSIVYIDLNSLKLVNDTKGHTAGDEYLRTFAGELGSMLRGSDIFGRIGGDEFLVVMPDCPAEKACERLREIRENISVQAICPISFSFGVVYVPAHTEKSISEYLAEADRLMYDDKKAGRRF